METILFSILGAVVGFVIFGLGYITRIYVDRAMWHHAMDKLMAEEGWVDINGVRKELKMVDKK